MARLWSLARRYGFDVLIAIGAVDSALEVALRRDAVEAPRTTLWFAVPAIAVVVLPLLARRRFRFGAPASVWVLAAALSFVDGRLVVFTVSAYVAGMASAFLLGNLRDALQARLGLAVVLGGAAIVAYNDPTHSPGDVVFIPILFAILWLAGFALRERAGRAEAAEERVARLERERAEGARKAVAEERLRIARELHDVIGHSVSVMTVQASAVRRLLRPEQEKELEALLTVEQTGREALAEMRRLVGVLRHVEDAPAFAPQPSLSHLEKLVEQACDAGLPVELSIEGDPVQLPAGIDLTAYRLVQEGLTNAIKHAHARHAEVHVRYANDHLEVEVCDDGRGADGADDGGGHGLVGMRERVSLYGGELKAGGRAEGGYRLRARLPVQA